ncbi:MAG: hypothetical protein SWX82_03920 [Cyanobacteriota bacterium]|nr:hypothetical protein [Cyanobacteriota bacterium]
MFHHKRHCQIFLYQNNMGRATPPFKAQYLVVRQGSVGSVVRAGSVVRVVWSARK